MSVSANCHFIERLFFESSKTGVVSPSLGCPVILLSKKTFCLPCIFCFSKTSGRDDSLKSPTCIDLVDNCPHLSSLALRGFKLHDYKVRILVKVC
jgi:F-box/leucine-rich repeat protein 2/20